MHIPSTLRIAEKLLLLFFLLRCSNPMFAGTLPPLNQDLLSAQWPAYWIASANAPATGPGVFYFRKELSLPSVPAHFWVHVSADNRFILHANGAYVAEGPARGDLFHWRFETVDLAPFLRPGSNIIAAVVWNFGEQAPVAQMSNRTGFLMQGDTETEFGINTGKDWQVLQDAGRSALGHEGVRGYYAAGPAERIDGRQLNWDWDKPASEASGWEAPRLLGHAASRGAQDSSNNWELVQDYLPPMERRDVDVGVPVRVVGLQENPSFPKSPVTIPANSHVTILIDHRQLQTAYPVLIVSGGRNSEIRLTYSEALYDAEGKKGNRNEFENRHIQGITDEFIADGGIKREFEPLWWRTWRYLQLDITTKSTPLRFEGFHAWFTAYPFEEKARITADIPRLPEIWEVGWRTARLNAHESYMDTPYWEQLQYVGDTRIQAFISYSVSGDTRLARQAIENIDNSRTSEGITESRYPSRLPQFIPTFSLIWVDMLHDYWMYVDDPAFVKQTLPHTRTVLDWFAAHLRQDGLLGRMEWWEFADWTSSYKYGVPPQEPDGGSTYLALQFLAALKDAEELESRYGSQERAGQYREIIRKASNTLNSKSWDEKHGLYADTPIRNSWSYEANILAVILDVAPRDRQQQILRRLIASRPDAPTSVDGLSVPALSAPSYYFRFYLSRALVHTGLGDLYLGQLEPWYKMLDLGLSTWAETPEPTRSDCHAWSASPNYDLLTVVAGIEPEEPGFGKVRIAPHLESLHRLEALMPHPKGTVRTNYEWRDDHWNAEITLPEGVDGDLFWKDKTWPLHPGTQNVTLP
jgi:hypothetical protein